MRPPTSFTVLKHASALAVALSVVGFFLFAVDGFLAAIQRYMVMFAEEPAATAPPPPAPVISDVMPVGVVPATPPAQPPGP